MARIRIYGDPVLRKKALPVEKFDDTVRAFVDQMIQDMYDYDGVGLAAPQVGESLRVAIVDVTGGEQNPFVLINPEITWASEELAESEEGCLSIPDINLKVKRPESVSVKAFNENGEEYTISEATGLLARALQHEIDHLNGILFIDKISMVSRQMVSGKLKKLSKSRRDQANVA
ncbi:MAG: peptide deformylase [Chitinivibrionales bacterium]